MPADVAAAPARAELSPRHTKRIALLQCRRIKKQLAISRQCQNVLVLPKRYIYEMAKKSLIKRPDAVVWRIGRGPRAVLRKLAHIWVGHAAGVAASMSQLFATPSKSVPITGASFEAAFKLGPSAWSALDNTAALQNSYREWAIKYYAAHDTLEQRAEARKQAAAAAAAALPAEAAEEEPAADDSADDASDVPPPPPARKKAVSASAPRPVAALIEKAIAHATAAKKPRK